MLNVLDLVGVELNVLDSVDDSVLEWVGVVLSVFE